jgi:plasmid stability protein
MGQITIRGVPEHIERAIRRKAADEHKSINRTVNELLQRALGLESAGQKRRDLSDLSGSWDQEEAEAFENATRIFEEIDKEVWR